MWGGVDPQDFYTYQVRMLDARAPSVIAVEVVCCGDTSVMAGASHRCDRHLCPGCCGVRWCTALRWLGVWCAGVYPGGCRDAVLVPWSRVVLLSSVVSVAVSLLVMSVTVKSVCPVCCCSCVGAVPVAVRWLSEVAVSLSGTRGCARR